jgi:putative redox protein
VANQKSVLVKQVDGIAFSARGDTNHWVMMDGPENFGGSDGASRPSELLLMALGGCTGSDVASILKKKRIPVGKLELKITAPIEDDYPHAFTSIHVEYIFYGNGLDPRDLERAIELSLTKYCSVSASLKPPVTHSYIIRETEVPLAAELA